MERRAFTTLLVLVSVLLGVAPGRGFAHPLTAGPINRYAGLESFADTVRLTYILDYSAAATAAALPAADTNHDGRYSDDELAAFARSVQTVYQPGLRVTARSQALSLTPGPAGLSGRPDANGAPSIKLTLLYDAAIRRGSAARSPWASKT